MKLALRIALLAATPVAALGVFALVYNVLGLPKPDELVVIAREYLKAYGPVVVLVAAVGEGILAINWYFPGSIVAILSVSLAHGDPARASAYVALICLGFYMAAFWNYMLGRKLWYRYFLFLGLDPPLRRAQLWFDRRRVKALYLSNFHPNVGALIATTCGIRHYSLGWFAIHSAAAIVLWNALWGVAAYYVGSSLQSLMDLRFALPILLVVGGLIGWREWRKHKKGQDTS